MRDINKKFSVRYYLNLVLIDEEERRYFKQQVGCCRILEARPWGTMLAGGNGFLRLSREPMRKRNVRCRTTVGRKLRVPQFCTSALIVRSFEVWTVKCVCVCVCVCVIHIRLPKFVIGKN